ncbi:hypothetical protein BN134_386 [Cronobacter dublinensis 1210]|uniref:Uncharacterized protein n=1 Tax=Cronobacter dublinensis 1210 TaxID=1208656 RepID=A0ABP1W3M7_9ENTR|nr:hypothetical protein BN134_386 [Cronobacter dublinensis 1210]
MFPDCHWILPPPGSRHRIAVFAMTDVFLPLDYRPLEAALEQHPQLEAAVAHELQPGRGYCHLTPDEIPAARAGLTSPVALIRAHAQAVLEEAEDKLR